MPDANDKDDWVAIAERSECPEGTCIERVAAGRMIALCNVQGQFFALDGVCPHQGGPLGQGQLCGHVLTCPWHGWQFDIRDGQHQLAETIRQPVFAVDVRDGQILVRLSDLMAID